MEQLFVPFETILLIALTTSVVLAAALLDHHAVATTHVYAYSRCTVWATCLASLILTSVLLSK